MDPIYKSKRITTRYMTKMCCLFDQLAEVLYDFYVQSLNWEGGDEMVVIRYRGTQ